MKRGGLVGGSLSVFVLAFALHLRAAEPEMKPIFNGQDLTGWAVPEPNPWWKVVDGVLVGENDEKKKGNVLQTQESYGDVLLEADVRWEGEIDSGFMVRKPQLQVQIGVSRSLKKDMTGSIYIGKYPEEAQAKNAAELIKIGEWNTIRVRAQGNRFTIWLNGVEAVNYEDAKYAGPAPIGLQIHPGLAMKVEFRNIRAVALTP